MPNAPIKKFKTGISYGVDVAVWEHSGNYTVSIQKRYKDKRTGEYKVSTSYFPQDLAAIQQLLPQAIAFIDAEKNKEQGERKPQQQELTDDDIPF